MGLTDLQRYEIVLRRFEKKEKNEQIAVDMCIDAATASRAIQEAFDRGILRLVPPRALELSKRIKERMPGLKQVEVVSCPDEEPVMRVAVARMTGRLITDRARECWAVSKSFTLGISGGRLMVTLADTGLHSGALQPTDACAETEVFAVAAAGSSKRLAASSNFAAGLLRLRSDGINATGFPVAPLGETNQDGASKEEKAVCPHLDNTASVVDFLRKNLSKYVAIAYQNLLEQRFDAIATSIGDCCDKNSVFVQELGEIAPRYLDRVSELCERKEIVGEFLFQPIDAKGNVVHLEGVSQPYLAVPLCRLRQLNLECGTLIVLSVAHESHAQPAISAYLGGYYNALVCTTGVAEEILKLS